MRRGRLIAVSGFAMCAGVALYALLRPEGLRAGVWLGSIWPASPLWDCRGSWAAVWAGSLPGGLWRRSATATKAAIWADQPG